MAYNDNTKKQALNLIKAGVPITEVAIELNINRGTLNNWINKSKDKDVNKESIESLEKKISNLSKRAPTEANSRKLAMLTKSLERLEKKSKKIIKKDKPKITYSADVKALKEKMLKPDYGLYEYQRKFILDESRFRLWLKSRQIGTTYRDWETIGRAHV